MKTKPGIGRILLRPTGKELNTGGVLFAKGNRVSATENLSDRANAKRMAGLIKCWEAKERKKRGEKFMTYRAKIKRDKRVRLRLKESVAVEAREIQDRARRNAPAAMDALADLIAADETNGAVKVAAIQVLLDRAYGKPNQTNTNLNVDANGKPTDVTLSELNKRITETLRRIEGATTGTPEAPESEEQPADVCERDRDPDGSTFH